MIYAKNVSQTDVLLKFLEFAAEQCQMAIDFLGVRHHIVDLVGEPHILGFLGSQIIFTLLTKSYIFYSNILTSISNFVFDSSDVCFPSFSMAWN